MLEALPEQYFLNGNYDEQTAELMDLFIQCFVAEVFCDLQQLAICSPLFGITARKKMRLKKLLVVIIKHFIQ